MKLKDHTRRRFLAGSAAALALTAVPHVWGEAPAAGNGAATLRWGIIGTGTRGHYTHVPAILAAPQSQLVALCDVADDRLQAAAAKAQHPVATCNDFQKLLANSDVNAVVIATPNLFHREILLAALQAEKHVLCEKPAGVSPADAAAMKQAAESAATVVMFGMQYRHNPRQRKIHEIIESGRIGKPRYILQNSSRGDWNLNPNVWQFADPKLGGKPMNWRFSHAATGGTLNEFDCHYFDLLNWFAGGLPQRVTCEGGISVYKDGRDTWDHAAVTLKYADDVTAVHTLSLFGPNRTDTLVMGDEGSLDARGETLQLSTLPRRGVAKGTAAKSQEVPLDETKSRVGGADPSVLHLYEDFLQCVTTGKKPDAGVSRAVAASRTCWLAELSNQRRAEVGWDELA